MGIGARGLDPSYFLTRFPQLFVDLRGKNERCHNEIGAPDYRIGIPFGIVLTPWDQNLFPVFGPVATAQEDSWRLDRVKSRPVSAFGYCGFKHSTWSMAGCVPFQTRDRASDSWLGYG